MEINIHPKDLNQFTFSAKSDDAEVTLCAGPSLSPGIEAYRPMQLILVSAGTCMLIDVLNILQKQKQMPSDYLVKVTAQRVDEVPQVFKSILIDFQFQGSTAPEKLERAIQLSKDKYCSVYKMLAPTVEITTKYSIHE